MSNKKGWRNKNGLGYINVWGYRDICICGRRMKEHRYIMECYLGRELNPDEHIHHINGNILDNRIENLQIMSKSEHHYNHHPITYPIENGMKKCTQCSRIFPIQRYSRRISRTGKMGYAPYCKSCQNEWNKARLKRLVAN